MRKHLLIYAHYYIPDPASTGQLLAELAEGLVAEYKVTVICVVPSYGGRISPEYKEKKYYRERINNIDVIRVRVPQFTKSNKISRFKNICTYFIRAIHATKMAYDEDGKNNIDYILSVSQPPIIGGLLGVWGKRTSKTSAGGHPKCIYQIQDFNPEQAMAINYCTSRFVTGLMMGLDKFSCTKADLVITVGRDLVETLKNRFTKNGKLSNKCPKVNLINNWIDENEIYPLEKSHPRVADFINKYNLTDKFVIMYSGNIGLYYDLDSILKIAERFKTSRTNDNRDVVFAFVGDGAISTSLVDYADDHDMANVVFIPYQQKEDLLYSLNAGDVHWCVNSKGIKGVSCPSKYYGLAACAKPVLAVLEKGSEIRSIIEDAKCGLICDPGDYKSIENNIRWFIEHSDSEKLTQMGKAGYDNLHDRYRKDISINKYLDVLRGLD